MGNIMSDICFLETARQTETSQLITTSGCGSVNEFKNKIIDVMKKNELSTTNENVRLAGHIVLQTLIKEKAQQLIDAGSLVIKTTEESDRLKNFFGSGDESFINRLTAKIPYSK